MSFPSGALRVEGVSNQTAPGTKIRNMNGRIRSVNVRLRLFKQANSHVRCNKTCHPSGRIIMEPWKDET